MPPRSQKRKQIEVIDLTDDAAPEDTQAKRPALANNANPKNSSHSKIGGSSKSPSSSNRDVHNPPPTPPHSTLPANPVRTQPVTASQATVDGFDVLDLTQENDIPERELYGHIGRTRSKLVKKVEMLIDTRQSYRWYTLLQWLRQCWRNCFVS